MPKVISKEVKLCLTTFGGFAMRVLCCIHLSELKVVIAHTLIINLSNTTKSALGKITPLSTRLINFTTHPPVKFLE